MSATAVSPVIAPTGAGAAILLDFPTPAPGGIQSTPAGPPGLATPTGLSWQPVPANNAPPFSINGIAGVQVVNADVGWWVGVHVDHFTVDWGDGTSPSDGTIAPTGTGATWLEGSHIYANAGTYTVNVSVFTSADATTPWHTYAAATATIAPATRRISAGAAHAIAIGFSTQAQWSLALPAPADQMPTVAIHWGDGSKPDHSATVWVSNGRAYVVASHAYSRLGRHRAVAVFSLNGKVVGRIAEVLKLQRASV